MATFRIVYPESRVVSVDWVLGQGFDAKVNAAVDEHVKAHGPFPDDDGAYEAFVATIPAPDVRESIEILEDLGLVTFARGAREA
jgi:hypothetical protein